MPRLRLRVLLLGVVVVAACGSVRVLEQTRAGGTIELEGDHNKAMERANETMASHCGESNFTVLSEGAEPIDPAAAAPTAAPTAAPAENPAMAYRVRYQCGDGAAVGSAPATPPPSRPPGS